MSEVSLEFGATYPFPIDPDIARQLQQRMAGGKRAIVLSNFVVEQDNNTINLELPVKWFPILWLHNFIYNHRGNYVTTSMAKDEGFPISPDVIDPYAPIQKGFNHLIGQGMPIIKKRDPENRVIRHYLLPNIAEASMLFQEDPATFERLKARYLNLSQAGEYLRRLNS